MLKICSVFALLFVMHFCNAQQTFYPAVETVASKFYATYNFDEYDNGYIRKFEKRPDGWHVAFYTYSELQKIAKDFLFWNASAQQFLKLQLPEASPEDSLRNIEFIKEDFQGLDTFYYNHFPYYGYRGWFTDVIELLKDKTNLNDTLTYALGRAYSDYASCMLYDNQQSALPGTLIRTKEGPDALTQEQLKKYLQSRDAAIECFRKTNLLNPGFETLIGSIYMKYCTEQLVKFHDLLVFQNEKEAMKTLPDNLFSDFTNSMAKNFLMTCDSNAVLFTNGDMDSYPLWYVQAKFNYRRDVLVSNLSLMNTSYYINFLKRGVFDSKGFATSFDSSEYNNGQLVYAMLEKENDSVIDVRQLNQYIKQKNESGSFSYRYFPNNTFELNAENFNANQPDYMGVEKSAQRKSTLHWTIKSRYILQSTIFLIDFLGTNNWQRPVYFTSTCGMDNMADLNHYLFVSGINLQVTPFERADISDNTGLINTELLYRQLMIDFRYDITDKISDAEKYFCTTYILAFSNLATQLIAENKNTKAAEVMDKCLSVFSNEMIPFDLYIFKFIENYKTIGQVEKAKSLMKQIIYNLKTKNTVKAKMHFRGTTDYVGSLEMLRNYVEQNNWTELLQDFN